METNFAEIWHRGKLSNAPSTCIDGRTVVLTGKWIKTAAIHDEDWEGASVEEPEEMITKLKDKALGVDIFTFTQKLPDTSPKFNYPLEWDNVAAVPITSYANWWEQRLPQEARKNVRRAEKRGVVVRPVDFDDALVAGIKSIYDEIPVRQGRRFWHYGKAAETVKRENSSYLDRCDFIGAFHQEELIGFIKMVYVGKASIIMQIVSKNKHYDKRPANALLAKAVEVCEQNGMSYLVYGRYIYGKNNDAPLTEFKRRNGFEQILIPRYYVPLTAKGRLCLKCNLHLGIRRLLPGKVESGLLRLRARMLEGKHLSQATAGKSEGNRLEEG